MGLLSICQDAAAEIGIPKPNSIVGNNNVQQRRLLRYANKVGKRIMRAHDWQALRTEQTFTAVGQQEQTGAFTGITDFNRFVPETMWNTTTKFLVSGPITPTEWNGLKAIDYEDVASKFIYRGGSVYMIPAPDAGDSITYEYVSENWAENGGTGKSSMTLDTDTMALGDEFDELMSITIAYEYTQARSLPRSAALLVESRRVWNELMENDQPKVSVMVAGDIFAGGYRGGRHFTGEPTASGVGRAWY